MIFLPMILLNSYILTTTHLFPCKAKIGGPLGAEDPTDLAGAGAKKSVPTHY